MQGMEKAKAVEPFQFSRNGVVFKHGGLSFTLFQRHFNGISTPF